MKLRMERRLAFLGTLGSNAPFLGLLGTVIVDVTLVLLVILMVTASYVVSRSIPMELPRRATGETTPNTLTVSIDKTGQTFLDAEPIEESDLQLKVRSARQADPETRAVIAADGRVNHAKVVRVIDLLRREDVTKFAFNVDPDEIAKTEK